MAVIYTNIVPPKYTQIGIFGLKRNHLATLLPICNTVQFRAWNIINDCLACQLRKTIVSVLRRNVDYENVDFQNVDFQNVNFQIVNL
jgi:uncharacterized protein YjbI with pentapeptide repeats